MGVRAATRRTTIGCRRGGRTSFCCLLIGVPDDLGWRVEQAAAAGTLAQASIALSARVAGAALFICALWVIDADAESADARPSPSQAPLPFSTKKSRGL